VRWSAWSGSGVVWLDYGRMSGGVGMTRARVAVEGFGDRRTLVVECYGKRWRCCSVLLVDMSASGWLGWMGVWVHPPPSATSLCDYLNGTATSADSNAACPLGKIRQHKPATWWSKFFTIVTHPRHPRRSLDPPPPPPRWRLLRSQPRHCTKESKRHIRNNAWLY